VGQARGGVVDVGRPNHDRATSRDGAGKSLPARQSSKARRPSEINVRIRRVGVVFSGISKSWYSAQRSRIA